MADTWHEKDLQSYRAEAKAVSEQAIIAILEKYKQTDIDVQGIVIDARNVLLLCKIELHNRKFPRPSVVRDQLNGVRAQASALSAQLAELSPISAKELRIAAFADDNAEVTGLERGDPYAKELRIDDAALMVQALTRWAERALEMSGPVKSGAPAKKAWGPLWTALEALYRQLTGSNAARIMRHAKTHPYGQAEKGGFRRFANDLMYLAGYRPPVHRPNDKAFSDDDLKKRMASLKRNMS